MQHLLGDAVREGRTSDEVRGELVGFFKQRRRFAQTVVEAPCVAFVAACRASGEEQFGGAPLADDARQNRAGAILAMASDLRLGTARSKLAFLFSRVGLAGCDMGACSILPRIIGQGRASELLFTGRSASGDEGHAWGFYNRLCEPDALLDEAAKLAAELVAGPTFAHGITKKMLHQEWSMSIDEAIESEAQAQAICMSTHDFERAYRAFAAKTRPVFEGD